AADGPPPLADSTVSVGVSLFPADATDPDAVLYFADMAMYASKRAGGGIVSFHDRTGGPRPPGPLKRMQSAIVAAARDGRLRMHLQPIVNPATAQVVMHECLLRWRGPDGRMVDAATASAAADGNAAADVLRRAAIAGALDARERLRAKGLPDRLSVNLSPEQFATDGAIEAILAQVPDRADRAAIVFEITEAGVIREEAQYARLDRLRREGFSLAVDDFGAGQASLGYLLHIPADYVKLDGHFVGGLPDPRHARVLAAMVALTRDLGQVLIVEGVETESQRAFLRDIGCPLAQGYLFGRAAPI
ncbi:MAG: EAL domain-containing protein, partial [Rhodobacteraceae bacterium]|nr:EAL domain-containing protein [Paracoccaceae bacterium]